MLKAEGKASPLTSSYLADEDVSAEVSESLIDYLTANTDKEAGLIVRGAQCEHGLEIWRRLSYSSEPMGSFSELRDTRLVTRPARCTRMSELT